MILTTVQMLKTLFRPNSACFSQHSLNGIYKDALNSNGLRIAANSKPAQCGVLKYPKKFPRWLLKKWSSGVSFSFIILGVKVIFDGLKQKMNTKLYNKLQMMNNCVLYKKTVNFKEEQIHIRDKRHQTHWYTAAGTWFYHCFVFRRVSCFWRFISSSSVLLFDAAILAVTAY